MVTRSCANRVGYKRNVCIGSGVVVIDVAVAHTQVIVCLAAISTDGLAQSFAYSTDAYAVLDVRLAACLVMVSAAVAVVAVDC